MKIEFKCEKNCEIYSMKYSEFNKFKRILSNQCHSLDEKITDFLAQSVYDGRISPDACELIYNIITDNTSKFLELENIAYFHNFLLNCIKNNSDMVWLLKDNKTYYKIKYQGVAFMECENEKQAQELFDNKEYLINIIASAKVESCDNEDIEAISTVYSENDEEKEHEKIDIQY